MRLKNLTLKNFRLFENLNITFHDKLTVLAGDNGSGKTSILEGAAIAVGTLFTKLDGISGNNIEKSDAHIEAFILGSTDDVQAQYPVIISADGIVGNKQIEWARSLYRPNGGTTIKDAKVMTSISGSMQQRLREGDKTLILPVLGYYGTGRLWGKYSDKDRDATRINGYINSLDGTANTSLMMKWFRNMTIQKYQRQEENLKPLHTLEAVYNAIEACFVSMNEYTDVKVQYNLNTNDLDVLYTTDENHRMRMPLSRLSDGYKSVLGLVSDIAYRMATLNPQLEDKIIEETDGIVLIDEVDLHLHPYWQERVLDDLTRIFPKVQFIVTTHAPKVINSVRSENLVLIKDCQPSPIASEVYGKDVNTFLKEIMEVDERPKKVAVLFDEFYNYLKSEEYDKAEETLNTLDDLRDGHDSEIANCRVKLKLERMRIGKG